MVTKRINGASLVLMMIVVIVLSYEGYAAYGTYQVFQKCVETLVQVAGGGQ